MMRSTLYTYLSLSALLLISSPVYAEPILHRRQSDNGSSLSINWSSCSIFTSSSFQCAVVNVPLDYAKPSIGSASLAVARYMHQVEPLQGSIFFNPGGLGESSVEFIQSLGKQIMNLTGGQYDVVTWDPRATGDTLPKFTCFKDADKEAKFWNGSVAFKSVKLKEDFTNSARSDPDVQAFLSQINTTDAKLQVFGKLCVERNTISPYVGTVPAVRDMLALNDAIEGAGSKINYWGLSYGTFIASVLTNMFSNRVGRVVYDSVVNPILYGGSPAFEKWDCTELSDTDGTFQGFLDGCAAAGPSACAIATKGSSADDLRKWIYKLSDDAFDFRAAGGDTGSADIKSMCIPCPLLAEKVTPSVMDFVFNAMYTPSGWAEFAEALKEASTELSSASLNVTFSAISSLFKEFRTTTGASIWDPSYKKSFTHAFNELRGIRTSVNAIISDPPTTTYAIQAITCADASDLNYTTTDVFNEIINTSESVPGGQFFGSVFNDAGFYCHRWPVRAVERYSGPCNATLSTKALIVSNQFDPITPRKAGILVADLLGADNVTFIEREGFGHISVQQQSTCINTAIGVYLKNGTLPTNGTVCALDNLPLFGDSSSSSSSGNGSSPNVGKNSRAVEQFTFSTSWTGMSLLIIGIPILASTLL